MKKDKCNEGLSSKYIIGMLAYDKSSVHGRPVFMSMSGTMTDEDLKARQFETESKYQRIKAKLGRKNIKLERKVVVGNE